MLRRIWRRRLAGAASGDEMGEFSLPMSPAERIHVQMCRLVYPELSYADIARRLNALFCDYNGGRRTGGGVYVHLKYRRERGQVR